MGKGLWVLAATAKRDDQIRSDYQPELPRKGTLLDQYRTDADEYFVRLVNPAEHAQVTSNRKLRRQPSRVFVSKACLSLRENFLVELQGFFEVAEATQDDSDVVAHVKRLAANCSREYGVRPFGKFAATGRIRGGSAGHPPAGS